LAQGDTSEGEVMDNETLNHLGVECLKDRIRDLERVLGRLMEADLWVEEAYCMWCDGHPWTQHDDSCAWVDAEEVLHGSD